MAKSSTTFASGFDEIVRLREPLAPHMWMGIGGPAEYFALIFFALTTVSALTGDSLAKGMMSTLIGLGLAVWLSLRDLARQALGRRQALDALVWALPVGLLVGRLVHVLGWWDYYLTDSGAIFFPSSAARKLLIIGFLLLLGRGRAPPRSGP